MISIFSPSNYAPFNIALEKYLLNNITQDCFLLYINEPCIIVGRFQNTLAEINYQWVQHHGNPRGAQINRGWYCVPRPGKLEFQFHHAQCRR